MLSKLDKVLGGNFKYLVGYLFCPHRIVLNAFRWICSKEALDKVVFVVGPPRSGTTLMQRILANHSKVRSFDGETSIFSPKDIYDYGRFSHLVSKEEFDSAIKNSRGLTDFFISLHVSRFGAGWCFLEKTPQHLKRIRFILDKFPNARVINVVRDPRDCYLSGKSSGNIPQCASAASYARYWEYCIRARMAVIDSRIFDVFYDDFVASPEVLVKEIMSFLGLCYEESQLSFEANNSDPRSMEKAFLRIKEPVSSKTVDRWKTELSEAESTVFSTTSALYESLINERKALRKKGSIL